VLPQHRPNCRPTQLGLHRLQRGDERRHGCPGAERVGAGALQHFGGGAQDQDPGVGPTLLDLGEFGCQGLGAEPVEAPPGVLELVERYYATMSAREWNEAEQCFWPDATITEYRGAHHTLEFEPPGCTFIEDLTAWIADRADHDRNSAFVMDE